MSAYRAVGLASAMAMSLTAVALPAVAFADGGTSSAASSSVYTEAGSPELNKDRQTLTVTADAGRLTGHTLVAVELASYSAVTVTGGTITAFDVADAGHAAAIDAAVKSAGVTTDSTYDASNPMAWIAANATGRSSAPWTGTLRDILTALTASGGIDASTGVTAVVGSDGSVATFAGLDPGVYLVLDTTGDASRAIPMMTGTKAGDGATFTNGDGTVFDLGTVAWKGIGDPDGHKKVTGVTRAGSSVGSVSANGTRAVAAVGDDVSYSVTGLVPDTTGYDMFVMTLSDTVPVGLDVNESSVKVTVTPSDGVAKDAPAGQYSVTGGSDGTAKGALSVALGSGDDGLVGDSATYPYGSLVTVTYDATVTGDVMTGAADTDGAMNEASFTLSDAPGTSHTTTYPTGGGPVVHTGALPIVKKDASGKGLAGAGFSITYRGATARFSKVSDGVWRYDPDGADATDTVTSGRDGTLDILGVAGDLTVKETSSPFASSVLPSFRATVTVNDDGSYTASLADTGSAWGLVDGSGSADTSVSVTNVRNIVELARTGTNVYVLLAVVGVLFATAAIAIGAAGARRRS